jgi:CheY-like chemotaxis protein
MGNNSSAVVPVGPSGPPPSSQVKSYVARTSQHSYTYTHTSKASSASTKSIVYKVNKDCDPENAEESLKSICKNDGLRRACLKFCIGCDIDFLFHVFIEAIEFLENPTETAAFEMLCSCRARFDAEKSIQVISRYEWQKLRDLIMNPDAMCNFDNARATIVTCKQVAVIGLSMALDSFLDSTIFESWERTRVKQEMNVLSGAPIRRGLARYGSCPNPRLIRVQNSVAAATAWVSDPDLDAATKIEAFATVFPNILVVDDSTVSVKLSASSFKADGHVVKSAHNGKVGFQMAMREKYQIIIVDLFMPVMNGFELIKLLRKRNNNLSRATAEANGEAPRRVNSDLSTQSYSEDCPGSNNYGSRSSNYSYHNEEHVERCDDELEENSYTPTLWKYPPILIAMTADNDDENIIKAFEAGADYFIEKPVTISKLADCLL